METRHLKYFIAVAEELSFTKAALRLHIAQPPLSQQIMLLEEELGVKLFDRQKRQITLTKEGEEFFKEAKNIIMSMEGLKQKISNMTSAVNAEIKIGMISSMASQKLALLLRKFNKHHPGIKITLFDYASNWQLGAIENGTIDIAFLSAQKLKLDYLQSHLIRRDLLKIAVPANHALTKKNKVTWKDLRDENFVLVDQNIISPNYYREFFELCHDAGFIPQVSQYTKNTVSQLWMVSAGLGVAPVPISPMIKNHDQSIALISMPQTKIYNEMSMYWKKNETSEAVLSFVEFFKNNFE